ncbi:TonB-dependent receptor [Taibaiella helva]|uniref:TonB-dependent receptor n=1 Tax=Taibaiella helva TaxID=2301235 RepID=UPI000E568B4A|nr:TonB-dependent receptor [Taibaiella helva]
MRFTMMCGLLFATLLTAAFKPACAQTALRLTGQVLTTGQKPADAASVALVKDTDSSVVRMTLADEGGRFALDVPAAGSYRVWISMTGVPAYWSDKLQIDTQPLNLAPIILETAVQQLQEVSITANKPFIERKIDRTVVNVDALPGSAGSTALDVLEKSPGIRVDQNGGISLRGKEGLVIYIDDRPSYLSGQDLQQYLRSLPASSLDQLEIMTNPPARYDAAGSAGVLNIKTKKSKSRGFNGNLNLAYTQSRFAQTNNSLVLNYREGKLNLFANLSYGVQQGYNDLDIYRRYKNSDESTRSYFVQNTYIRRRNYSGNARIGADLDLDKSNTLGILLTGSIADNRQSNDNTSNMLDAAGRPDSLIKALNTETGAFRNGGVNLNYRHKFAQEGRQLTADLDYIAYSDRNEQTFDNHSFLSDGSPRGSELLQGTLPADIGIMSVKTDYTQPIKGYTLSAGAKASYTRTDNLADYRYTTAAGNIPDYDKSNHFIYRESIGSAYANLAKAFGKLSLQAGLRLEHTQSDGHQLGNAVKPDSAFKRTYTNLFPTFYASYKIDSAGNHVVNLNYGRRINRPYYQDLNPFLSPFDKFTYYVGNPFLKPSFTNSIELSYVFRNRIVLGLSYSDTRDDVNETIEINDGIYYSRPGNIGRNTTQTLSVDATQEIFSWLEYHGYTEVANIHSRSDFYTGRLDAKGTYWFLQSNVRIRLGKDWVAYLGGRYITNVTNAQFVTGANGQLYGGLQKNFGEKITLKANLNDIFHTAINKGTINNLAATDATYHNRYDSRQFTLSFSYRFGKAMANERQAKESGAESEKSRVKQ